MSLRRHPAWHRTRVRGPASVLKLGCPQALGPDASLARISTCQLRHCGRPSAGTSRPREGTPFQLLPVGVGGQQGSVFSWLFQKMRKCGGISPDWKAPPPRGPHLRRVFPPRRAGAPLRAGAAAAPLPGLRGRPHRAVRSESVHRRAHPHRHLHQRALGTAEP